MPGGSGTGPMGMGPMTGRAAGYCAGSGTAGYADAGQGRGFGAGIGKGRGFGGGGRGWRNMSHATGRPGWMRGGGNAAAYGYPASVQAPDPDMERRALRGQVEALQAELELVSRRLGELGAEDASD